MPEKPLTIPELVALVRAGTEHLANMAKQLEFPWNPAIDDPIKLHNMYAHNLVTSYVSKFADLSAGVVFAIEQHNFLMYAVCGRALLETTAILRYYVAEQYKPILDKGTLSVADMQRLIQIDDQHLRGGKFDWESFLFRNYSKMKEDVVNKLATKGKKSQKPATDDAGPAQVRIGQCFESWAAETPEAMILYNLFCDLVHPNVGSSFLVASVSSEALYFSRFRGASVGQAIMEQSFPVLVSATQKPFGKYLLALMGTIWQDAEQASAQGQAAEPGAAPDPAM